MRQVVILVIGIIVAIPLLLVGTAGVSLALENQDAFCAACHTEPESKYYAQSIQTNPLTLAAYHRPKQTACIDCHSGGGSLGRMQGLVQGADDLKLYVTGNYRAPAITSNPLGDDACLKCHATVTQQQSRRGVSRSGNGHYHQFLTRWQAADARAAHCVTCHSGHVTNPANQTFLNNGNVATVCEHCHSVLGGR